MNLSKHLGPTSQPASKAAICTLFEGDYHFGLAALVNSLVSAGYTGTVWAGYRGVLPPWLDQLKCLDAEGRAYLIGDQVRLVFLPLETKTHFTNYKPQFMLSLLENQASTCDSLWYFDPDIFLRCGWSFFEKWQRYGIALCEDVLYHPLPNNNVLRQQWAEIGTGMGLGEPRPLIQHFNGGMVGLPASCISFLHIWKKVIDETAAMGYDLSGFLPGTREMPLHATDQDALNIATMFTEHPLSTLGPEGMGFINGGFTMYHAIVQKPWRGSILRRALAGDVPSAAIKIFFTQVSSPIRAYSPMRLRAKRLACAIGGFIGRFYTRR
jgi:hypothetical protein